MGNLAMSYSNLGRHEDALAMEERVLEFRRRVLPENHPSIGEGRVGSGVPSFWFLLIVCLFCLPPPPHFIFTALFQRWLATTSVSAWSEPALCLVL
jgi:hypothetical protein